MCERPLKRRFDVCPIRLCAVTERELRALKPHWCTLVDVLLLVDLSYAGYRLYDIPGKLH